MSRVFEYLTKDERIWALDRGVVALNAIRKFRLLLEGDLPPGTLPVAELELAMDRLFQMSVELECDMPFPSPAEEA